MRRACDKTHIKCIYTGYNQHLLVVKDSYCTSDVVTDRNGNTVNRTLDVILKEVYKEKYAFKVAGELLDATQLYFDSITDPQEHFVPSHSAYPLQRQTLERLLQINGALIESEMCSRKLSLNRIKKEVREMSVEILKSKTYQTPHDRYLDQHLESRKIDYIKRFYGMFTELFKDREIDTIVYIASGGLEAALVLKIARPGTTLLPIRYSRFRSSDDAPLLPSYVSDEEVRSIIEGKSVIVVDDDIDRGVSMCKVLKRIGEFSPKKVYCATVLGADPAANRYSGSDFPAYAELLGLEKDRNFMLDGQRGPAFYSVKLEAIKTVNKDNQK